MFSEVYSPVTKRERASCGETVALRDSVTGPQPEPALLGDRSYQASGCW